MDIKCIRSWALGGLCMVCMLLAPGWVAAQTSFGSIVVFGDSLSDPGNLFALGAGTNTPPYDELGPLLIPDKPYARGGNHFSNGATWIEQLALDLGLAGNTLPAYRGAGSAAGNYAVGGARAHADGINVNFDQQVTAYLGSVRGAARADTLYVVEFGSNDIRDALSAYASGADGGVILGAALTAVADNIGLLYGAGARKFLVCNAPDFSLTPAIRALDVASPGTANLARLLSITYNAQLDQLLGGLAGLSDIEIVRVDFYQQLQALVTTPADFGLSVIDVPCVMPNLPPFVCPQPGAFLFWDGAHPTVAVHAIMADTAATALGL